MCDCDEMEFEDFEVRLASLAEKLPAAEEVARVQVPVIRVASKRVR